MKNKLRFTGTVKLRAKADGPRKLRIEGYGGGVMNITGFAFPLVVELSGMSLPGRVPILMDHRNEVSCVVGSGVPETDGRALVVNGTCTTTEAANEVVGILESGTPLQASIGAEPIEQETIQKGESVTVNGQKFTATDEPLIIVRKSILKEITVCPLGADASTAVYLTASARLKGNSMNQTFEEYVTSLGLDPENISDEVRAALQKAYDAEQAEDDAEDSTGDLQKPANAAAVVGILAGADCDHLIGRAHREKWTKARANREALNHIRESRAGLPHNQIRGKAGSQTEAIEAGLLIRAGFGDLAAKTYGADVAEQGQRYSKQSMPDITASLMRARGKNVPHDRESMIRAGLSGGDLSVSLSNVMGKVLQQTWKISPKTWDSFANVKQVDDFKQKTALRPSFAGGLTLLPRGGDVDHGTASEETYTYQVDTFAKQFAFDRRDVMNDDLNVISEVLPALGRAAITTAGNLVFGTLMSNLSTLYTTGRGNYLATGPLTSGNLEQAVRKMRLQTSPDGSCLALQPMVLLVPPNLEWTARALLSSSLINRDGTSDKQPMGNSLENLCDIQVEPRLERGCVNPKTGAMIAGSVNAWFLFAGPADLPFIFASTGAGEGPTIQQFGLDANPDRLAISFRAFSDFGAALGDYRASVYSTGS